MISKFVVGRYVRLLGTGAVVGTMSAIPVVAQQVAGDVSASEEKPMNVLFLVSDDLRADLRVYGHHLALTPNLDKLAGEGVRFEQAYCQYPLSGPSCTSLLTGRRPTTSGVYSNNEWYGATYPDWMSLPKYFQQHGYSTLRSGKVFHGPIDDTDAWTEGGEARTRTNPVNMNPPSASPPLRSRNVPRLEPGADPNGSARSDRWEAVVGDAVHEQGDTRVTNKAIEYIRRCAVTGERFFITCGLSKPHSPLVAPKEFFDLYDINDIKLPPDFASLPMIPPGFPAGAIRPNNADLFVGRTASEKEAKEMILAYLACVSYVDWNIGRVLNELEKSGLAENTIIVFWSDHGYQLGEKGKWSKAGSMWEQGCRVPFMIYDPRVKSNGTSSPRIVELVDIYPTLVDLCELPPAEGLDGVSLRPLLDDPLAEWDRPAYTVWNENQRGITGVAVRTERWRYAEFYGRGAGAFLTDPINDPHELVNLVDDPAYAEVVAKLHKLADAYTAGKRELPPED